MLAIVDRRLRYAADHERLEVALEYCRLGDAQRVFLESFDRRTHCPACTNERPDARADDRIDLHSRFHQRANHADVRHPVHRSAAQN